MLEIYFSNLRYNDKISIRILNTEWRHFSYAVVEVCGYSIYIIWIVKWANIRCAFLCAFGGPIPWISKERQTQIGMIQW